MIDKSSSNLRSRHISADNFTKLFVLSGIVSSLVLYVVILLNTPLSFTFIQLAGSPSEFFELYYAYELTYGASTVTRLALADLAKAFYLGFIPGGLIGSFVLAYGCDKYNQMKRR